MSIAPVVRQQAPVNYNPGDPRCEAASVLVLQFNASAPPWTPPAKATMAAVVSVVVMAYSIACLAAFVALRKKYQRTKVRPVVVPVMAFVGLVLFLASHNVPAIWGAQGMPCWFHAFISVAFPGALGVSFLLKTMYFLLMTRFATALSAFGRRFVQRCGAKDDDGDDNGDDHDHAAAHRGETKEPPPPPSNPLLAKLREPIAHALRASRDTLTAVAFAARTIVAPIPTREEVLKTTPAELARVLDTLKFVMSSKGQIAFSAFICSPFLLFAIVMSIVGDPAYALGCFGCYRVPGNVVIAGVAQACLVAGLGLLLLLRVRGLKDPFGVFWENRLCLACCLVGFAPYVISLATNERFNPTTPLDLVSISILINSFMLVFMTVHPLWVAHREESRLMPSPPRIKRRGSTRKVAVRGPSAAAPPPARMQQPRTHVPRHLSTSAPGPTPAPTATSVPAPALAATAGMSMLTSMFLMPVAAQGDAQVHADDMDGADEMGFELAMVLANPRTRAAFEAHVQTEFCTELLVFLDVTERWKQAFGEMAPATRLSRAKRIAKTFIGSGAVQQVNVGERVSERIFTALAVASATGGEASSSVGLKEDVFDEARRDVMVMLEHGALRRFFDTREGNEERVLMLADAGVGEELGDVHEERLAPSPGGVGGPEARSPGSPSRAANRLKPLALAVGVLPSLSAESVSASQHGGATPTDSDRRHDGAAAAPAAAAAALGSLGDFDPGRLRDDDHDVDE